MPTYLLKYILKIENDLVGCSMMAKWPLKGLDNSCIPYELFSFCYMPIM